MIYKKIILCPYCDSAYSKIPLKKGQIRLCDECHSVIDSAYPDFQVPLIFAITAFILFWIANTFPFIQLNLKGEQNIISIYSSIEALFKQDLNLLAILVCFLIIIIPAIYFATTIYAILSFHWQMKHELTRSFLFTMVKMTEWNMIEVYLVGLLVTLVKIMQMAEVYFLPAFWIFGALIICSLIVGFTFNLKDALFFWGTDDAE